MINANKNVTRITTFDKAIIRVIAAGKVIWELISSCFGSGYWINERPWINSDGWNNG